MKTIIDFFKSCLEGKKNSDVYNDPFAAATIISTKTRKRNDSEGETYAGRTEVFLPELKGVKLIETYEKSRSPSSSPQNKPRTGAIHNSSDDSRSSTPPSLVEMSLDGSSVKGDPRI